ncbi:2TM domain-containing protein [Poritiphilus flavus]|uniref:Histidine kinase n=1 Tax=Poritiphilus flavus TaxID=2697053 RepID=A0A6L9EAM4_9FLAO|nr:2TM domain-containing protein [Poritiphilus flavus]NAS11601.1 histidine kinase [Poritiphilus flavus]
MEQNQSDSYLRAKKKVDRIKGFYRHLGIYIVINLVLLGLKVYFFKIVPNDNFSESFVYWLDWNIISTPIIWGVAIIIHGLVAFQHAFTFIDRWEDRKIRKFMDEDQNEI